MPSIHIIARAAAIVLAIPAAAFALDARTEVAPPPRGAPFEVKSCSVVASWTGIDRLALRVRALDAARPLERLSVSVALFDDAGTRVATATHPFTALGIAPGETAEPSATEVAVPVDASVRKTVRSAKCRVVSATFAGGATWTPNRPWKGRLLSPSPSPEPSP